eukprot:CAMPEP_0178431850 /NCGR_PEP_ID=MMETSP0689_2-20121128/32075_1 /TAXON_ID=160604 /ORGANISM="Amphidinium massartii, Strain CS-259" /LENGTH=369 /DNA_ID=CAMNT_0020053805 /DNA_START=17 /DNA_END=1122 /DNA_ORIENTATION=+
MAAMCATASVPVGACRLSAESRKCVSREGRMKPRLSTISGSEVVRSWKVTVPSSEGLLPTRRASWSHPESESSICTSLAQEVLQSLQDGSESLSPEVQLELPRSRHKFWFLDMDLGLETSMDLSSWSTVRYRSISKSSVATASTATPRSDWSEAGDEESPRRGFRSDADEARRVQGIEEMLDLMNTSSEDLNVAQADLAKCEKQLQKLHRFWAVQSARLARVFGYDSDGKSKLVDMAPFLRWTQRAKAARKVAEEASAAFLRAQLAGHEGQLAALAARHKATLEEFLLAQKKLDVMHRESGLSRAKIEAIAFYADAESEHKEQVSLVKAACEQCRRRIQVAKTHYTKAMRSLEAMSEDEHRSRAEGDAP